MSEALLEPSDRFALEAMDLLLLLEYRLLQLFGGLHLLSESRTGDLSGACSFAPVGDFLLETTDGLRRIEAHDPERNEGEGSDDGDEHAKGSIFFLVVHGSGCGWCWVEGFSTVTDLFFTKCIARTGP